MTVDSAQISRQPSRVTTQRGMLSSRPTSSMSSAIRSGSSTGMVSVSPEEPIMVETMPWAIWKNAVVMWML